MKFRHWLVIVAGLLPLSLFAVVLFLALYSRPAVVFNGPGFVVGDMRNLGNLSRQSRHARRHDDSALARNTAFSFSIIGTLPRSDRGAQPVHVSPEPRPRSLTQSNKKSGATRAKSNDNRQIDRCMLVDRGNRRVQPSLQ